MYSNSKLISFDAGKLEALLQYVKVDWRNINEKKIAYKFPNVSAELLSISNDKICDFFQTTVESNFVHIDFLMQYFVEQEEQPSDAFNYTRSGYICKILNSLILNKNGIFESYFLRRSDFIYALIMNCHCKSVATTILNIITLISTNQQTPMMIAAAAGVIDNKNELCTSNVIPEIVQKTLEERVRVFLDIIENCIESANKESLNEVHSNLAWIIMQVLSKNTIDRAVFMKGVFLDKLGLIVDSFTETFHLATNNKLGNIFLVILEIMSKETTNKDAQTQNQSDVQVFCIADLPKYLQKCFKALADFADLRNNKAKNTKGDQFTHTFTSEIQKLNPKVYKVIEAVNVALNLYITNSEFTQEVILKSDFPRHVFSFLTNYPFNNILHNQIKKMLFLIIEKGSDQVIDYFFSENPEFFKFIENLTSNKYIILGQGKKIKHGFVGQTITIINALKQKSTKGIKNLNESKLKRRSLEKVFDQLF